MAHRDHSPAWGHRPRRTAQPLSHSTLLHPMINEVEHYTNDPSNDVALEDALSNLRREARDLLGALDTLRRHGGPGVSEALCHQAHEIEHSLEAVTQAVNDRRNGE